MPADPQRVLSSLTVINRTPSPLSASFRETWTSATPRTATQLEQHTKLTQELLQRSSQSPLSRAIQQIVKGCELALYEAALLKAENAELRVENNRRKERQQQPRYFIATGGALQVTQARQLTVQAENVEREAAQLEAQPAQRWASPTCSNCHV